MKEHQRHLAMKFYTPRIIDLRETNELARSF